MNEKDPIFLSLAMIEERLQEKLTVEILAEGVHFSKYHYQRIFREAVGETVMGYVNRRRLFLAAGELAGTGNSVLSVALKYGYDSHEGFTRSFKAYLGVTPTEYRKYHSFIGLPGKKKEEGRMMYSKSADEMIRELNSLIVQARETAAESRKYGGSDGEGMAVYGQVWEFAAGRTEKMAGQLEEILRRVASVAQNPDEISSRMLIVKAVEDTAFEAGVTAFQVGLMIARAMPEHRAAFRPLCASFDRLAQSARMRSGKIVDVLNELWGLILQDMRKNARQRILDAVETGRAAADKLSNASLPYGYIAEAVREMAEEIAVPTLEEVTVYGLEDILFRLDSVLFAADMDMLRAPQHRQLFDGISNFKEKLEETAEFFRNLSGDGAGAFTGAKNSSGFKRTTGKIYGDVAAQEGILLFYLKGEIQKLGDAHLDEGQKTALETACGKMERAVRKARRADGCGNGCPAGDEDSGKPGSEPDEKEGIEIAKLLREAAGEITAEARRLGVYGGALQYLAEEVKKPLKYLPE